MSERAKSARVEGRLMVVVVRDVVGARKYSSSSLMNSGFIYEDTPAQCAQNSIICVREARIVGIAEPKCDIANRANVVRGIREVTG